MAFLKNKKATSPINPDNEEMDEEEEDFTEVQQAAKVHRIISFVGENRGHIAYYLIKLLSACNEPVLLVDNSESNEIFHSINRVKGMRTATIRNITYVANVTYEEETFDPFTYIVIYYGNSLDGDTSWWDVSDLRLVMTGFDRYEIRRLAKGLPETNCTDLYIIFADRYSKKIRDEDVLESLYLEPDSIKDKMELTYEPEDLALRIAWEYNGSQKIGALTKNMLGFLEELYQVAVPTNKNFKQVVKLAD